jgi:twitching motility protein PilT
MITNPAIANLIREDKVHQLYSQMQLNQTATSMTTQTQEIIEFLRKKIVSKDIALQYSNKPDELLRIIESM